MSDWIDNICALAKEDDAYFCATDLETNVKKMPDGDFDPMPYGPNPPEVLLTSCAWEVNGKVYRDVTLGVDAAQWDDGTMCAGANFKFDAQHILREGGPLPHLLWDVMIAEYILTAQQSKFASLGDLMQKYLGTTKKDLIGENLAKGITPDKIDPAELREYAKEDAVGTLYVAQKQWRKATVAQRQLILVQGSASLAYAEMEFNGMPLDKGAAVVRRDAALGFANKCQQWFKDYWIAQRKSVDEKEIMNGFYDELAKCSAEQYCTNRAVSAMLFHHPKRIDLTYKEKRPGVRKQLWETNCSWIPARDGLYAPLDPATVGATANKDGVGYSVSEEVLQRIVALGHEVFSPIAKNVLKMRAAHKLGTTYYQNLIEYAERYGDDRIHHTIHATSTDTGRTSSAKPNSQNQPEEVREVIVAPEGWDFFEFDFSQLEVCALAHLSGDANLIDALNHGSDIHFLVGKEAGLGKTWTSKHDMPKDVRRDIKSVVFGMAYGGGATTLSAQSGVPKETVEKIMAGFYKKFPGTKVWQDYYYDRVKDSPTCSDVVSVDGGTARRHTMESETGRMYAFTEKDSPEWMQRRGVYKSFTPTQTKNYPVQGFATGDIVPLAIALLREALWSHCEEAKLVTAVHDSILLQIKESTSPFVHSVVTTVIEQALPDALEKLWGIKMSVPLRFEYEVKKTWAAKKK